MSTPRRTLKKEAEIGKTAGKTPVSGVKAPVTPGRLAGGGSAAKAIGKAIGGKGKGRGPVYEVPKPVRPRTVKK